MDILSQEKLLGLEEIRPYFNLLKENMARSRLGMTVVFIKAFPVEVEKQDFSMEVRQQIERFLMSKVRNTDLLFKLTSPNEWGLLLMQSAEKEATAFLQRIFQLATDHERPFYGDHHFSLCAMVAEIKTKNVDMNDLLNDKKQVLHELLEPWKVLLVTKYKKPDSQLVKVSIVENNEIFRGVLKGQIEKLQVPHITFDIAEFVDGHGFLESNRHLSSHTHIVIMNDILPRKNGLEVLGALRSLPNQKKFIIYMMTKRNSQTDMINAYESGADQYLIKPFDLRLFKAQLLRTLERLQS